MDRAVLLAGVVVCGVFLLATRQRNEVWRDSLTLWQDVAAKSPEKVRPLVNLGIEYQRRGDKERAIDYLSRASAAPHGLEHNRNLARANLAWLYFEVGQLQTAIEILNRILSETPDLRVMNMLALFAVADGGATEGLRITDDILRIESGWRIDPQLHLTRGQAFQALGRCFEANMEYGEVKRLQPNAMTPVC